MGNCKRMLVQCIGIDGMNVEKSQNYNKTECKNIKGACGCVHAEIALLEKMKFPEIVIVTHSPCIDCAKALVKAGVQVVIYREEYRITKGKDYLINNGVVVVELDGESTKR